MRLDVDSLERIVPDEVRAGDVTGEESLRLSKERYLFSVGHVRPGRLLDLACGSGYGTRLLTERAPQVNEALGVDLSQAAIDYAGRRYSDERTRYVVSDAKTFHDSEGFDTIVSIETIEHLEEPGAFVDRLVGLLRPRGVLIGSVPVTPSVDANPHHLHDFSERSFRALFRRHGLIERAALLQDQPFSLRGVLTREEARMKQIRPRLLSYYARHPGSLVRRLGSTLRHGLKNRYLTLVWEAAD